MKLSGDGVEIPHAGLQSIRLYSEFVSHGLDRTKRVEFTSTSSILQFLNSLDCPRTSLTLTLLPLTLARTTSLNTVSPLRMTLNSHIVIYPHKRERIELVINIFFGRLLDCWPLSSGEEFWLVVVLLYVFNYFQCDLFGFYGIFSCDLRFLVMKNTVYEVFV